MITCIDVNIWLLNKRSLAQKRWNEGEAALAMFTTLAREGKRIPDHLMDRINARKVLDEEFIHETAPSGALFLASSRAECELINRQAHVHLVKNLGKESILIWAHHTRGKKGTFGVSDRVNALSKCPSAKSDHYYKFLGSFRNKVRVCIGSRVRCLKNACPIVGLFQGAIGTVVGFGLPPGRQASDYSAEVTLEQAARANLPVPLVYVQMDIRDGFTSEWADTPGVVCFSALQTPSSANGHPRFMIPLLPAHARTYHSAQGLTAIFGVVLYRPVIRSFALMYVGISRIKALATLFLMKRVVAEDFQTAPLTYANVEREHARLRTLKYQIR